MASEESEAESKPNGNYINSFVSFLQGSDGKDKITEVQSEDFISGTGDVNTNSVEAMEGETRESLNVNDNEQANGSPNDLCNSKEEEAENTENSVNPSQKDCDKDAENTENSINPSQKDCDKDGSNSTGFIEDKDSDSNYNSENDSRSSSGTGTGKNVAKRGRKRKHTETNLEQAPQRETPRRAARNVKCYLEDDAFNELDEMRSSDPDYNFSDSDDDPDFDPSQNRGFPSSPDAEARNKKGKGNKGRSKAGQARTMRRSVESTDEDSNSDVVRPADSNEDPYTNSTSATAQKRRGRPPVYQNAPTTEKPSEEISDNTVSSTDDATKTSGKLSSAYNYATTRTRQNQAIRLPEGPNLTDEQLKLIESQFKSGDFVMAKKDTDMMENPPIWRIDGKSLLQKFQAFEKDGKMLYRNISTYSGWTSQAKALYVPVKVNFVFQSRYDTVVELVGFKGIDGAGEDEPAQMIDKPVWLPKNKDFEISEELRVHMPSFEIYLQTLISQALDNNFLQEIYEENDSYFVDRVKVIDELTEQRKEKILHMAKWDKKFQTSLDTWPCVNTMVTKNTEKCQACGQLDATMLSQFYGQPYDQKTLRSKEPSIWDLDHKNFETCDSCSILSQLYNKVAHQKYDYYSQCKSTVTNMRVSHPNKSTTNVLRDLLANDEWITGLFRAMCTTWIKVDTLHEERPSQTQMSVEIEKAGSRRGGNDEEDPDDPVAMETNPESDDVKEEVVDESKTQPAEEST